jgi:hypothetical protein
MLAVLPCTTPPKCAQAKGLWSLTQACGCALAAWPATMWRLCGERPRGDAREPRGARRLYRYSTRYLQGISRDLAPRLRDSISPPWASTSPPQRAALCVARSPRRGRRPGEARAGSQRRRHPPACMHQPALTGASVSLPRATVRRAAGYCVSTTICSLRANPLKAASDSYLICLSIARGASWVGVADLRVAHLSILSILSIHPSIYLSIYLHHLPRERAAEAPTRIRLRSEARSWIAGLSIS